MSESNWKQYFNQKADNFGGSVKTSDYFNEKSFYIQRENTLKWLGELKGLNILDAGCGVGAFTETLVKDNNVFGVDFSEKSLEFASKRGLKTTCGDLGNLQFEDGYFDIVLCIGVIQLIPQYTAVLKEFARVVKPGGTLLIETLNSNSVLRKLLSSLDKSKKFDRMYSMKELGSSYESLGFKNIEFMRLYQPLSGVSYSKSSEGIGKYCATSYAIKGKKF